MQNSRNLVGRPTQLIYISDIYFWSTQKYKYEEQRSSCWAINYSEPILSDVSVDLGHL